MPSVAANKGSTIYLAKDIEELAIVVVVKIKKNPKGTNFRT